MLVIKVTTAATLALESIYILCKESVIDIRTTVKVISPKCSKDQRSRVVEAYCRILGLAPTFRVAGNDYANFLADTLNWLWRTAVDADKPASVKAGLYIFLLTLHPTLHSAHDSQRLSKGSITGRIRS